MVFSFPFLNYFSLFTVALSSYQLFSKLIWGHRTGFLEAELWEQDHYFCFGFQGKDIVFSDYDGVGVSLTLTRSILQVDSMPTLGFFPSILSYLKRK